MYIRAQVKLRPYESTIGTALAGDLTANFSLWEFASGGTAVPHKYLHNVRKLAKNLQKLRDQLGRPVTVTSGYRTLRHNANVGGASKSQHLTASAADIKVRGLTPSRVYCMIEQLISQGRMDEGGLGIYNAHVHYDVRGRRARWAGKGVSIPVCSSIGGSASQLAANILSNPNITLATFHVSGVNDNATARQNIVDTSTGQPAARSNYGNAPGGSVQLDIRLLQGILDLAARYTLAISELAGGSHSKRSRHYAGIAMDVNFINGQHVGATHPDFPGFMQACRDLGATEVLGPGYPNHDTHIHCAWPRP